MRTYCCAILWPSRSATCSPADITGRDRAPCKTAPRGQSHGSPAARGPPDSRCCRDRRRRPSRGSPARAPMPPLLSRCAAGDRISHLHYCWWSSRRRLLHTSQCMRLYFVSGSNNFGTDITRVPLATKVPLVSPISLPLINNPPSSPVTLSCSPRIFVTVRLKPWPIPPIVP
jgi:hypothetical protein